jgi:signal transduction histidine kinase/ActR/RegA family two-component response regulator
MILSELAPLVGVQHGVFYLSEQNGQNGDDPALKLLASYAYRERKHLSTQFRPGEGLVGQAAYEKERILLTNVPGDYVQISSGLGEAPPLNIIVLPILFEGAVRAVIELASFAAFSPTHQSLLDQLTESIGLVLNTVDATSVTDKLLKQSQSQAQELQSRQEELRQSNEDLAEQAALLAEKNSEVEGKYQEVEEAKRLVEEKASELAVSSKYKSEFIANMSHELRTPLNSLLVLAEQLEDNPDGNLTERQVKYAQVIRSSGVDLLKLLNDILDLAKVESKTVTLDLVPFVLAELRDAMTQTFGPLALQQGLEFSVEYGDGLPVAVLADPPRLRQVLKNLLANAFKFTESGSVHMRVERSEGAWTPTDQPPGMVVAVRISDTGIGIREDLHASVFEAFAQADGTTARRYGGTGLGLSISRDLVRLMGGEIVLESGPGRGSVFTVYLPVEPVDAPDVVPSHPSPNESPTFDLALEERRLRSNGNTARPQLAPGTTVLIVDDDFRNIFALTALLERGQLTVVPAQSGAAAIEALETNEQIDLVLMDIMMPVMNGYEAMTEIRRRPKFATLPILAVTGKVVGGERERCIAAGASDCISKPVDTEALLTAISAWFPAAAVRADTAGPLS